MKQRLLILTDWFYPGYKAGGIITSVYDLAMLLRDEYSIFIMTSDRDLGDSQPYGESRRTNGQAWTISTSTTQVRNHWDSEILFGRSGRTISTSST
ncbi:hypothetical protein ACQ86N_08990 [Puia sp. P3]|uniref:hypothetical protein n=1 Tax=Puia sp. P3 TaxID=3423952 RepID=UPI003D66AAF3